MRIIREADIRYGGQSMEVRVAGPAGAVDAAFSLVRLRRFMPRICAPSATIMPASRRSSWSISASQVSG